MYDFLYYQVKDVMTANPITVKKDVSLSYVEAIFTEHDFNGLPVIDESHRLIGMMTKLDFLKAFAFKTKNIVPPYDEIMGDSIVQIMTTDPSFFSKEAPLTRVVHQMIDTKNKSFPVVESDRVIGIVAREDVIKALRQASQGKRPGLEGCNGSCGQRVSHAV